MKPRVRVESNGCWVWLGRRWSSGYGRIKWGRRKSSPHRVSMTFKLGEEIPWNRIVHHKCRNRACFNPDHLELMSEDEHAREHGWDGNISLSDHWANVRAYKERMDNRRASLETSA